MLSRPVTSSTSAWCTAGRRPWVLAMIVELVHTEGAQLRREAREELAGASAAGGR